MFPRPCPALLITILLLALPALTAAEHADDAADFLLLEDSSPLVIRVRVQIDGKTPGAAWADFVRGLFDTLDEDHDGVLDAEEADGMPTGELLRQLGLVRRTAKMPEVTPWDRNPRDGKITYAELADYVRQIGIEPLSVTVVSQAPQPNQLGLDLTTASANLFSHLDSDGNEKLSVAEFTLSAALRKFDLDDDETISREELGQFLNPYVYYEPSQTAVANDTPIIFLNDRQGSSTQLVQQVLERYDRVSDGGEKDHRLSREEIKLDDRTFAKLDADANGHLDFDELRQWLRDRGTSVEVLIPLRQHESQPSPVQMITPADQLPSGTAVRSGADGSLALVLGHVQCQFLGRGGNELVYLAEIEERFKAADVDGNGYLEGKEVDVIGLPQSFIDSLIDRDGDGKVFLSELKTFFNRVFALRNNRTVLSIRDLGKQLFEVLDTSADGRLSSRELIAGQEKIPLWDQQGDREVSHSEVPRHWSWSVLRGQAIEAGTQASAQTVRTRPAEGPRWFTRMDRNNDGDLTPREFLGSAADFEQFDRNRDGAIDAAEAVAAHD